MRDQIEHVLRLLEEHPSLTFRLLSATAANNPAQHGGLTVLHFDDRTPRVGMLPVVYGPSAYLDEPADTDALVRGFNRLRELALGPEESRAVLEDTLSKELTVPYPVP